MIREVYANNEDHDYESSYQRTLGIARRPGDPAGAETGTKSGRGPDQGPCDDGQPDRLRHAPTPPVLRPVLRGAPPAEAHDPRHGLRGGGRGGRPGVTSFKPGDRVFGLSPDVYGAHAEYLCVPEKGAIAAMPAGARFSEAVVCEGAWYADTYLQAFRLKPGHSILVYGASGAIGTAAVQLAKSYGAKVTAVVATRHLDLVRTLGADRAVDYTAEDFTQIGETFDCVLDAVGKTTYFRCRRLLKPEGVFAATDLGPWCQNPLLVIWSSITGSHRVIFPLPQSSKAKAFVDFLKTRMEAGEFRAGHRSRVSP